MKVNHFIKKFCLSITNIVIVSFELQLIEIILEFNLKLKEVDFALLNHFLNILNDYILLIILIKI